MNVVLTDPYGGRLVDLMVGPDEVDEVRAYASRLPSVQLSERSACDLELLAMGACSPLDCFMGEADYRRVLAEMRLASGHIFPIPLTLPTDPDMGLGLDRDVALRDARNELLGMMTVEEIYSWDVGVVARAVCETEDLRHPLVAEMHGWGRINIAGRLRVVQLPRHADFRELRLTPRQMRTILASFGRPNVVAFQPRGLLHRAAEEMTKRAIEQVNGSRLLHPAVGVAKPGDVDHYTRLRSHKILAERYYEPGRVVRGLLPLATRWAGPREALWHALVHRNYGANYVLVQRDDAPADVDSTGKPFFAPHAAQKIVERFSGELGVRMIPFQEFVYLPDQDRYEEVARVPRGVRTAAIASPELRDHYLHPGRALPDWFTRLEVAQLLTEAYPPRHRQGICVGFTGLSGAGKSTTTEALTLLLLEHGRQVTLLDGDVVRTHLSKGLGFSKEDRDTNIRRIGFVAAEIVRHGGIAVCATVSPYWATRNDVRAMVGSDHFVEVYVDTPLEVCEQRDAKGMYAKARRGEIKGFTGIDDPYEPPLHPEVVLDTVTHTPEQNARLVLDHLRLRGFVRYTCSMAN